MAEDRKTVIITGASRGIGHTTARLFLDRGWQIITCSRDDTPEECKRDPNWTCHIPTDLGDAENMQPRGMQRLGQEHGAELSGADQGDADQQVFLGPR